MIRPTAISISQFRSFRRRTTMELRPLTLLYGPNNVGKSALLRVLPLFSDSIAPGAQVPVVLSGLAGRGATLADVFWVGPRASNEPKVLTLGLEFPEEAGVTRVDFEIDATGKAENTPIVRACSVWRAKPPAEPEWRAQRLVEEVEDPSSDLPFEISGKARRTGETKLRFEGLVPVSKTNRLPGLDKVRRALEQLRGRIQWLTAPRVCEERLILEPVGASPNLLDPRGGVAVLQALRADAALLRRVSGWYEKGLGAAATQGAPREIRFEPVPPAHFRPKIALPGASEMAVNLADAGAGWVQLLPVLTALAMAERERGPRILAIEEPESNLHPSAQRAIAEALTDVVRLRNGTALVLETHSFPLLQYVQLQILQGKLSVDDVVAYWVAQSDVGESQLVKGVFDDEGRLSGNWPSSAFVESLDLAREISVARRKRGTDAR